MSVPEGENRRSVAIGEDSKGEHKLSIFSNDYDQFYLGEGLYILNLYDLSVYFKVLDERIAVIFSCRGYSRAVFLKILPC